MRVSLSTEGTNTIHGEKKTGITTIKTQLTLQKHHIVRESSTKYIRL